MQHGTRTDGSDGESVAAEADGGTAPGSGTTADGETTTDSGTATVDATSDHAPDVTNRPVGDATTAVRSLPETVESPRAKLVLLYLRLVERADVNELAERLRFRRITLFPVLESLASKGLVERRGEEYAAAR